MEVRGEFRTTGAGAFHGTAIVEDDELVWLDEHPKAIYEGRDGGYEGYSLEVPEGTIWLQFYRSNRGNERVLAYKGLDSLVLQDFRSFELAKSWVSEGCPE